jgi:hypothetical protein
MKLFRASAHDRKTKESAKSLAM